MSHLSHKPFTDRPMTHPAPPAATDAAGAALRQRAETRFANRGALLTSSTEGLSPDATEQLLHELRVHQIELEMQNDELCQAQMAIDTARASYFDFYDMAPVSYCSVDEKGLICQANLTMARLIGVMRNKLLAQSIVKFIMVNDQDVFYIFREKLLATSASLVTELRMKRADGSLFWASLAALAVPAEDGGTVLRMVLNDITERKQAEEKLQLAACVFNHAGEGILVTDLQGNILDVNHAFTRITGYTHDEVLGRNPRILSSGLQDPGVYANLWRELADVGHWSGEIWNRRKNGEVYAEMLSISAVRDAQGTVRRYVALFSDLTEIKSHQQQIEHIGYFDALTGLPSRVLKPVR